MDLKHDSSRDSSDNYLLPLLQEDTREIQDDAYRSSEYGSSIVAPVSDPGPNATSASMSHSGTTRRIAVLRKAAQQRRAASWWPWRRRNHGFREKKTDDRRKDDRWHMFDNLSCDQAEDILRRHGDHGTYLISHFHDPESYGMSIRLKDEEGGVVFEHYSIAIASDDAGREEFTVETLPGRFGSLDAVVLAVQREKSSGTILSPLFHIADLDPGEYSLSVECPPSYGTAEKCPSAPERKLPGITSFSRIVPNSWHSASIAQRGHRAGADTMSESEQNHGCCWKAFHTDPNGDWYYPHKAGYVTAVLLALGWIAFLVLFGPIIILSVGVLLVFLGIIFCLSFIATGSIHGSDEPTSAFA